MCPSSCRASRPSGITTWWPLRSADAMSASSKFGISTRALSESTSRSHAPGADTMTARARNSSTSSPSPRRLAQTMASASSREGATTVIGRGAWPRASRISVTTLSRPARRNPRGRTTRVWLIHRSHHASGVRTSRGLAAELLGDPEVDAGRALQPGHEVVGVDTRGRPPTSSPRAGP